MFTFAIYSVNVIITPIFSLDFKAAHILLSKGSKQVFEELYHYYTPRLQSFLSQYISQKDEVEGLVQDCFAELWARRENFQKESNLNAWLYTVAKNKALKFLSKEAIRQRYVNQEKYAETHLQLDALSKMDTQQLDDEYLRTRIGQSIRKLSKPVREVFIRRRFEGKSNKEVADELNISIKTVEAHITKALKQLRSDLNDLKN